MNVVAGVDLGGTAINYTIVNEREQFLIEGLCEHPALSIQGPDEKDCVPIGGYSYFASGSWLEIKGVGQVNYRVAAIFGSPNESPKNPIIPVPASALPLITIDYWLKVAQCQRSVTVATVGQAWEI